MNEPKQKRIQTAIALPQTILCNCGEAMTLSANADVQTAVCPNPACQYYRVVFIIEYPKIKLTEQ